MQSKIPEPQKTVQKTIRFPAELVQQMEEAIDGTQYSFSRFVVASVRFTIKSILQPDHQT